MLYILIMIVIWLLVLSLAVINLLDSEEKRTEAEQLEQILSGKEKHK